ncbi:MAG: hypothetical protein PVG19_10360 [Desulfobacterales bacterium]
MIKAFIALTAMAAAMLLLNACSTRSVTTTGAITRTQCVAVPLVPAGSVSLRLEREGECDVDPDSVIFEYYTDCKPCQHDCAPSRTFSPVIVDAGKAYCSGTSDFCARCIKVYDFKEEEKEFACVEYAATKPGFFKPRPVRFLQCIDANGDNCNEWVDCKEKIDTF